MQQGSGCLRWHRAAARFAAGAKSGAKQLGHHPEAGDTPMPTGPFQGPDRFTRISSLPLSRPPGIAPLGPEDRNTARQAMDGLWTEVCGQQKQSNDPRNNQHILDTPTIGRRRRANGTPYHIQHSPNTPTTGLRERGNDTSRSTGRSGRQNAATRRNMRREERGSVQGPVKEQQPDGMSHRGPCLRAYALP